MQEIILASGSERRIALMKWLGIPHRVVPSDFDESLVKPSDFEDDIEGFVVTVAMGKALAVLEKFPNALVISADTIVCLDGKIFGKPRDLSHAREMLRQLRGKQHTVYCGVVMINGETQERRIEVIKTQVTFSNFSDRELEQYIATSEPYDKAGGYALQGWAAKRVERIDGSSLNVVGFPLITVRDMLEEMGVLVEVNLEQSILEKTGFTS